ncbi:uncharacterized protein LOC105191948 [Harpegnathos saltator]|uniref:uncharacterized protein LOC105191948 n=1 Tax=Harpegnathos saltator TaxID=610380 RepID=UPI000DBED6C1|nr:uncharacterized protein LOC105191948 [Harpegnathos saltator]
MPPRLYVLVNIAIAMVFGVAFSEGANRNESDQIERPIVMRRGSRVLSRDQDAMSFARSSPLFFLHLLKHKLQFQKLERITSTTTTTTTATSNTTSDDRACICVPFYLCNANQTIITDGMGVIDVRSRRCAGAFEVCCYLPNITTPRPTTTPTMTPTTTTTTSSTTTTTTTTTTARPPNINCICVEISLCDPNGIVTISGEGIINPRRGLSLCPGANQVCCRILATTTTTTQRPTNPPTSMTTSTSSPGQIQLCFVCGNAIQCITCGLIISPGTGVIDPRFPLPQTDLCSRSLTSSASLCQDGTISSSVELLGPLKNPGTSQACYCVKTWMCSEGNVVSPDGLGVIDPRFTTCSSADQVCCLSTGIDLQVLRSGDAFLSSPERFIANMKPKSLSQTTCGIRDDSYAPSQPFPADSEKTYFAEFPWMVALLVKSTGESDVFQCGGSMINDRAVLTAAHCVISQKPENLVARFGQWDAVNNAQALPAQEADVLAIITHPTYYSGGLFHDVAVLVLEKSITYSANILPICLPEQGMVFAAGTRCYGTGWGSSSFGPEGTYQAKLRKVDVPIVDRAVCQTRLRSTKLGEYFQLHGSFICAGGEANKDMCRGDGGGPLACQTATGQFFQAGIVSWGIGCGTSDIPAVYTSVSQHRQWIDKQLATYGVCIVAPSGRCSSRCVLGVRLWHIRILGSVTMWRLVSTLTLLGTVLVTALPAAQNPGDLGSLIDQVFPSSSTTPQSVPQIGGDIDTLIKDVFGTGNVTTAAPPNGLILGSQNTLSPKPDNCECVPYYQCKEGKILETGIGIIDIRSGFGGNDRQSQGGLGPCENYLDVCCKPPDTVDIPVTPTPDPRVGCGKRNPEGVGFRITGQSDNEAQFGEFPWMVAILKEEAIGTSGQKLNVYQCGGALIHQKAVLTAAHCVNGKQPHELKIRAGEWDTMTKSEVFPHQDRDVETIVVHEKFHSGALFNDYALLILKEPVEYAENVDIVCLPETGMIFDGSKCFASGWGKDVFGKEGRYQVILKRVELPIVPHNSCQDILRTTRLGNYFRLDKSFICAGGEAGKDTCKGDGGSPLVCPLKNDPRRYVQAGIVAWGLGCGEDGTPGVYASISNGRNWIDEQMAFHNLDNTVYQYRPS